VDKTTLAALEATLRGPLPPVQQMLAAEPEGLRARAGALAGRLTTAGIDAVVVDAPARVGGGGAPEHPLAGVAISLPAGFAEPLRMGARPVVGYLEDGRTLLNLRSLAPEDDAELADAVLEAARRWT
jgi:L-seryl-tRNA(Ser) seleniumtransferase